MNEAATHHLTHWRMRGLWLGKEKWKSQCDDNTEVRAF